jgi:valyl-tRNA synthetase
MSTQLAKSYDPHGVEQDALRVWNDEKLFHTEPDPGKRVFSMVIPPPNVTAALHLGHALNNTLQDILIRWHRMIGDNTVWLPGTDHAGIATQHVVEKRVLKEQGKKRTEFARDDFVAKIQAFKDEYEQVITNQLKLMGCSCDWDRQAFTMDPPRVGAVREAFFRLFRDGLIYRGKRLVNWDPATQTALADDEVEMEEVDGHFYYVKYPIVEDDGSEVEGGESQQSRHPSHKPQPASYVTVATTRPETMLGDTAVGVNPRDPRAAALRGKKVRLPIVNRIIPIIEDDYVVLPDPNSDDPKARYATGFLKVTPAHDTNDYDLGIRHSLPMINVLAPDGTISDKHGWSDVGGADFLLGMDRYEARKAVVEWFRQNKLLEDVKPYRHSVGHSYRSHVPIEPYLSDQWYCKVTDPRLARAALDASRRGALRFFPERYARTFDAWHENIRDWCISRQLWWGHRIPVWRLPQGRLADRLSTDEFAKALKKLSEWQQKGRIALTHRGEDPEATQQDIADRMLPFAFACVRDPGDSETIHELEKLGAEQDPDVLDTWFSSALWPISTMGWPDETAELKAWNPTSTLCTAREIITLWVSRMVMFNLFLRNCLPFTDVCIHAMIQDGEGRKMSKSLGNGVDPLDIIASHGADAMRFTLAHMSTQTQDVRMPVERDPDTGRNTSPKFDIGRNFANKLWNAARFALMNLESAPVEPADETKWSMFDRWIVARLMHTMKEVDEALSSYRFDAYAKACYDFFWRDLCDWYVEAIKPAMKDPKRAGQTSGILAACLDASLRLMHPMIPFITETLFWKLNEVRADRSLASILELAPSKRCIRAAWPRRLNEWTAMSADFLVPKLQEIIISIRQLRNDHKVDPKRTVSVSLKASGDACRTIEANREIIELLATCELKAIEMDLAPIANAAKAQAAGCEIYVEGLIDQAAEQQRAGKRREELTRNIAAMKARLANEGYIAKAPAHLVKQTQEQLAAAEAELLTLP